MPAGAKKGDKKNFSLLKLVTKYKEEHKYF